MLFSEGSVTYSLRVALAAADRLLVAAVEFVAPVCGDGVGFWPQAIPKPARAIVAQIKQLHDMRIREPT